ncbi:MAG: hypothetical protein Q8Q23_01495 [bacterium]|nr:hypothetical protein [bacterium]
MNLTTYQNNSEQKEFWQSADGAERIFRDGTKFIKEYQSKEALYGDMDFHRAHSRQPLKVINQTRVYFVPLILAYSELSMTVYLTSDARPLTEDDSPEAKELKEVLKQKGAERIIADMASMKGEKSKKIFLVLSVKNVGLLENV